LYSGQPGISGYVYLSPDSSPSVRKVKHKMVGENLSLKIIGKKVACFFYADPRTAQFSGIKCVLHVGCRAVPLDNSSIIIAP
jgi:hypothetical protein